MTTTKPRDPGGARPALPVPQDPAWTVRFTGSAAAEEPSRAAQTSLADGVIGTAGSPPIHLPHGRYEVIVANVFTGTDAATDLLRVPTWTSLEAKPADDPGLVRTLDLRAGVLHRQVTTVGGELSMAGFSSLADPGVAAMRVVGADARPSAAGPLMNAHSADGAGAAVPVAPDAQGRVAFIVDADPGPGGVAIAARDVPWVTPDGRPGFDRFAVYLPSPRSRPDLPGALARLAAAEARGFDNLLGEHRSAWAARWDATDITIAGDPELQGAIRFSLFHLMGSIGDRGEAAVGARGLSGPSYRGHVFWDADVFGLPFMAATHPASARAMLEYRFQRLEAARANAAAEGLTGAWYPWESAGDGHDVTPRWVTGPDGQPIRIWTGDHELHITADVAWAAQTYIDWTGDRTFAEGAARRIFVETARYWASRVEVAADGTGHISKVVGPDEYHELVDDNVFTNVMARWNLRHAARECAGEPDVTPEEVARWEAVAAGLVDGYDPALGRHEQFRGFSDLDPLIISEMLPRPVAADAVLPRETVWASQIVKQADVLMLHLMVPGELPPDSLIPDLEFYEPRTSHGSSLSPGVHAALFARVGRLDEALDVLRMTARMDLDELLVSASGGMHAATIGALWQALVIGFGGIRPDGDALAVDPRLPASWGRVRIPVAFRGSRVEVRAEGDRMEVCATPPVLVRPVGGPAALAGPDGLAFLRVDGRWVPA